MLKKYKAGVIGSGAIVELSHIPVLKKLEDIEIAWQYDKCAERSAVITKMFQVPALKEEVLDSAIQQIDICLLTIPYGARKDFIEKWASKNKSLYVEKPFATKSNEHINYCNYLLLKQQHWINFARKPRFFLILSKSILKDQKKKI